MAEPVKGADDSASKVALKDDPDFKAVLSVVATLGKSMQSMQKGITDLQTSVGDAVKGFKESSGGKKPEPPEKTEDDINTMSQAELVAHIFGGVRKMVDGSSSDLKTMISGVKTGVEDRELESSIRTFAAEHADFQEWIPEIKKLIQETPGLSVDRAYTIARQENLDKSTELDEKFKKEDTDAADKTDKPKFGGLMPTSGITLEDSEDNKEGRLTQKDAAEKAFTEIFGEKPELISSE